MLQRIMGRWELSIDLCQWMFGFNFYKFGENRTFNIFFGPVRIGWWEGANEFWE